LDDRVPVPTLTQNLWGDLFGDKGYISQKLWQELWSLNLGFWILDFRLTPYRREEEEEIR
jgi:hypothetical protein